MQTIAERQMFKLETLQFVLHVRDVIGTRLVMRSLLEVSKKTWDESFDGNTDIHLIEGVSVGAGKTDAIKTYIAKLVKVFLNVTSVRVNAWTNESICNDNFTNIVLANKVAGQVFMRHEDLFQLVVTRLLGFDPALVAFTVANAPIKRKNALVVYLAQRYSLGTEEDKILEDYQDAINVLGEVIEAPDYAAYFDKTVAEVIDYFDSAKDDPEVSVLTNPLDILVMFYIKAS